MNLPGTLALTLLTALLLQHSGADAAPKKPSLSSITQPPSAGEKLIWDAWYTITLNDGSRYGYYNDRVELRKGRVFFSNHVWKMEENYINEEQLGAYAEPDENLTPLFYNFHSVYRTTETQIDGTVTDGRLLSVKSRRGDRDFPQVKKSIPPRTLFSVLFPVWLKDRASKMKPGDSLPFSTVIEDNIDQSFSIVTGRAKREKSEPGSKLSKFLVDYKGVKSFWYLDSSGVADRIEMPAHGTVVQRVSEEAAKKFLAN